MNCFRFLGFKSFEEVDRLTMPEYEMLMKAEELRRVDEEYIVHLQAYLNVAATAKKVVGKKEKYVYDSFRKFFDYDKRIEEVMDENKEEKATPGRFDRLSRFLKEKEDG